MRFLYVSTDPISPAKKRGTLWLLNKDEKKGDTSFYFETVHAAYAVKEFNTMEI